MTAYDSATGAIVPMPDGNLAQFEDINSLEAQAGLSAFSTFVTTYGDASKVMSRIQIDNRADLTLSQKRALVGKYESGPVEDITKHLRRIITIQGAVIKYHGAYFGKSDGKAQPGYFYMLLATDMIRDIEVPVAKQIVTFHRNLLIKVSATQIVEYFLGIMQTDRWYDFTEPVVCFFDGQQSTGYTVSPLTEEEAATVAEFIAKGK